MDALARSVCLPRAPDGVPLHCNRHRSLHTLRHGSWCRASFRHSQKPLLGRGGGAAFSPPTIAMENRKKTWSIPMGEEETRRHSSSSISSSSNSSSNNSSGSSSSSSSYGFLNSRLVDENAEEREEEEVSRSIWGVVGSCGCPNTETLIRIMTGGGGRSSSSYPERFLAGLAANSRPIGRNMEEREEESKRIWGAGDDDSYGCRNEETLAVTRRSSYLERFLGDSRANSRPADVNVNSRVSVDSVTEVSRRNCSGFEQVLRLAGASILLGLGFSFATPAWAKSAPSLQPPIASIAGTSLKTDIPTISPPEESSPKLVIAPLGESFWKNFQPSIGSAEQLMKLYLDRNPNNVKALESLLYSRLNKKDTATAIVILERMMQLQPDELEWKHMKSSVHEDRGEFDKARQGFQEILDDRPFSARALQITNFEHLKLSVHEDRGEFDKARHGFQEILYDRLLSARALQITNFEHMKSSVHKDREEFDKDRQGFQEILDDWPLLARALQGLVLVMDRVGESKEALDLIEATVRKATQEENALDLRNLKLLLAQFHTLRGNLDQALQVYGELVQEDPYDFRPYLCQGLVYSVIGEKSKAEENFLKYRQLCPKGFPNRDYYDDLMLKAEKNSEQMRKSFEKHKKNLETKPQKHSSFDRGNDSDSQQKTDS